MKKYLLIVLLLFGVCDTADAKKEKLPDLNIVEWSEQCSKTEPGVLNGVELLRFNLMGTDGVASVTGTIPTEGLTARDAMAAFMLKIHDYMEGEEDNIYGTDLNNNSFSVMRTHYEGEGKEQVVYNSITTFYFNDGIVSFVTRNVNAEFKEKGLINRKLPVEKLKPLGNDRHKAMVEAFVYDNSKMIDEIKAYAVQNPHHDVTHWNEIALGKVEKGMNKTEVAMIGGVPASVSQTGGGREQWVYDHTFLVMFLNDEVVGYVQK